MPLALDVPADVHKMLTDAARRRDMLPEDLATGLVGAVLTRGNIEEMLNKWNGYLMAGHRVRGIDDKGRSDKQKPIRGASEQPAQAGEV